MDNSRYLRNNLIDWFSQETIHNKHYAIIGCGAVGNEVIKNLVLLGVGKLDIFDFDKIEIHNLTKSIFFRESDIGKYKADVLASRAIEVDPNVQIFPFIGDFYDKMTLDMLKDYDAVISCVDNFESRIRINQICALYSKDLINTGIDSRFVIVDIYPFSTNENIACYECNLPASVYHQISKRYSCGWLKNISSKEKIVPTTPLTASLAGALASSYVLRIDDLNLQSSRRTFIDSMTGSTSNIDLQKRNDCKICSIRSKNKIFVKAPSTIGYNIFRLSRAVRKNISFKSSEPILTEIHCLDCDTNGKNPKIVFKKARDYDSSISTCPDCGGHKVKISIKDSFSLGELVTKFYGYNIPCKYIMCELSNELVIIEMEENNERNT